MQTLTDPGSSRPDVCPLPPHHLFLARCSPALTKPPGLIVPPTVPLGALKGPLGGRCPWPLSLIPSMLPSKHSQLATANRKLMAEFLTSGVLCSVPWFLREAPRLSSCPVPITPGSLGFPPASHPALAGPSVFPQLLSSSRCFFSPSGVGRSLLRSTLSSLLLFEPLCVQTGSSVGRVWYHGAPNSTYLQALAAWQRDRLTLGLRSSELVLIHLR